MRKLLMLVLMVACGSRTDFSDPAQLCAAKAGHWDCAPNAVCVTTQNGWVDCVCCTLAPDAGWAVTIDNLEGDCAAQRRMWAALCPAAR